MGRKKQYVVHFCRISSTLELCCPLVISKAV